MVRTSQRILYASGLAFLILFLVVTGCTPRTGPRRETQFLLGTTCTVQIHDSSYPEDVFRSVFDRVRDIQYRMTITGAESEIISVNRSAGRNPVEVSPDTLSVVRTGLEYSRASGGAFDITIGPVVQLWGIGTEDARVPEEAEIADAVSRVGYEDLEIRPDTNEIFLRKPGMVLDLGGIAKGYAVDEAVRIMTEAGIKHGLVDFGGDIRVIRTRPDGEFWRIGIQDPVNVDRGSYIGVIRLEDTAVVTSGDYERFLDKDGTRYHHILDSETGAPARSSLRSVTVVADNATVADAVSTAVFVMGREAGLEFLNADDTLEGLVVTAEDEIYVTPGLRDRFTVAGDGYTVVE
jgi:FAD:protein FMN transferase